MKPKSKYLGLAAALLLVVRGASSCPAVCAMSSDEGSLAQAQTPICHVEKSASSESPSQQNSECTVSASSAHCCCLTDEPAGIPTETQMPSAIRDASGSSYVFVSFAYTQALRTQHDLDNALNHGDLLPPGAPLFIAHHSLLI